jgi:hypothetical protein
MTPIRIKPELLSLLISERFKHFTAEELHKAYIAIPECRTLTPKAATQFIQRNLSRLEKKGLLVRTNKSQGRHSSYQLTDMFIPANYKISDPHCSPLRSEITTPDNFSTELHTKLNHYKQELLTTMGEVEEYDAISSQAPKKREHIQKLYNEARDRFSRTLGKVRAIESLITQIQSD